MPGLTSQDIESYQKLYGAATRLRDEISSAKVMEKAPPKTDDDIRAEAKAKVDLPILKSLTIAFVSSLPGTLASFEQLQSGLELTGGYLTMYQLFTTAIDRSDHKDSINPESQELRIQYNQLKVSLAAIDDDFLDDLIPPCSDPLFLGLLTDVGTSKVKSWTQQLLSDQAPALSDSQVQELIDAWGRAVTAFVKDTADNVDKVEPGEPKTIAQFFCIHNQLEGLYSELSTAAALNS
ncbi:MAG: hypothetical protein RBJ76_01855 [Stenomitos frigidus ULC029]